MTMGKSEIDEAQECRICATIYSAARESRETIDSATVYAPVARMKSGKEAPNAVVLPWTDGLAFWAIQIGLGSAHARDPRWRAKRTGSIFRRRRLRRMTNVFLLFGLEPAFAGTFNSEINKFGNNTEIHCNLLPAGVVYFTHV